MLINCYAHSLVITWSVLCVYLCYTWINYILFGSTIGRGCVQICCLSDLRQTNVQSLQKYKHLEAQVSFTVSDCCRMALWSAGGAVKKTLPRQTLIDSAYNPNITSNIFSEYSMVSTSLSMGAETYFKAKWWVTALSNVTVVWQRFGHVTHLCTNQWAFTESAECSAVIRSGLRVYF